VFDILSLDDGLRSALLNLSDEKMADVAVFCNSYPNIEVSYVIKNSNDLKAGEPVQIDVKMERDIDEDDTTGEEMANLGKVTAPLFPNDKKESWWIVVGDVDSNHLLSVKRVDLRHKLTTQIEFLAPEDPGDFDLRLFCICDSYLGCDQEFSFSLSVAAADLGESDDDST
jgi:pre-mRNA-splicing helicase BRR2